MDEFDEETDETHDGKPDRCGHGNFLEFWRKADMSLKTRTSNTLIKKINKKKSLISGLSNMCLAGEREGQSLLRAQQRVGQIVWTYLFCRVLCTSSLAWLSLWRTAGWAQQTALPGPWCLGCGRNQTHHQRVKLGLLQCWRWLQQPEPFTTPKAIKSLIYLTYSMFASDIMLCI